MFNLDEPTLGDIGHLKVAIFMRRPRAHGNFSVEIFMRSAIDNMDPFVEPEIRVCRFESRGIWRRAYSVVEASLRQGEVNHVTGDVTFLTYLLKKRKTLLTILDCGSIRGEPSLRKLLLKWFWFTLAAMRAAKITVISEFVKNELIQLVGVAPSKIEVVPVSVSAKFTHTPKNFNQSRPIILQLGAAPNKNRDRLIEAISGISCEMVFVGELNEVQRESLSRQGTSYTELSGLTDDELHARYIDCDLVAFPSTYEGFGMPIVEGNLVGRAVLAGNVASMPEVSADAACLVNPFDVTSIRAGILKIIHDQEYREKLIASGFENAQRFSAKTIAARYTTLYKTLSGR